MGYSGEMFSQWDNSVVGEVVPQNYQLFLTIEALDEAITNGKKVEFSYNEYGVDKALHLRKNKEEEVRRYMSIHTGWSLLTGSIT